MRRGTPPSRSWWLTSTSRWWAAANANANAGPALPPAPLPHCLSFPFQTEGSKVQRDLKAYLAAVKGQCEAAKQTQQPIRRSGQSDAALLCMTVPVSVLAMHDASRRLQDCLADMYEPDWFGKEELDAQVEVRHLLRFPAVLHVPACPCVTL